MTSNFKSADPVNACSKRPDYTLWRENTPAPALNRSNVVEFVLIVGKTGVFWCQSV
jgi:hypothetical protein